MLRSVEELYGYTVLGEDSEVGEVDDFLFDDGYWITRYLVIETGGWLSTRRVLVATEALKEPNWIAGVLPVALTEEQVKRSPPTSWQEPVSRQHEEELAGHYGWDYYWLSLQSPVHPDELGEHEPIVPPVEGIQLRSTRELLEYNVEALDGEAEGELPAHERVGYVANLLIDDENWAVRYLVVTVGDWLPNRQVLVAPQWVDRVDWTHANIYVDLTREMIEASPEYDPTAPVEREYEEELHDYYERPKYWM